jgi:prefoldin subunit 5
MKKFESRSDTLMATPDRPATPLGIPPAEFIEDLVAAAPTVQDAERLFQEKREILAKYRMLESHLIEKSTQLKRNRPDVVEDLSAVRKLASRTCDNEPITHFQISDALYGSAKVKNDGIVAVWLGANLMVEYSFADAEELLKTKLERLDAQLAELEANLVFLRNQIITTEVTVSRVTNYILSLRRKGAKQ